MKAFFIPIIEYIKRLDSLLILNIILLQTIGIFTLYSATHGMQSDSQALFQQQIIWQILGWLAFFIISSIDYFLLRKVVWPLYFIHIILLILVIFFGKQVYTSKRWLDLGWFNYQPSEFLKLVLVLVLAHKLSQRKFKKPLNIKKIIEYGLIICLPIFLVALQPDLGTAGITLLITGTLILFNGINKKPFIFIMISMLMSLPLMWNFGLKQYQKERLISFIQPNKDPRGQGYNLIQSKIAIGNGKIFGKGFKKGTQTKLHFLPERHTDFIFSVLSEEHGFVGSTLAIVLFFTLLQLLITYSFTSRSRFGCILCLGCAAFIFWHIFLNLAMTMGLIPVVGAPLTLMSYGGSHFLTAMIFLGLASSVNKKKDLF